MMCACHAVPLFGAPDTFIRVGKPGPRTQNLKRDDGGRSQPLTIMSFGPA